MTPAHYGALLCTADRSHLDWRTAVADLRSGLRVRSRLTGETGTLLRVTPAGNPVWRPDGSGLEITNGAGEIEEAR